MQIRSILFWFVVVGDVIFVATFPSAACAEDVPAEYHATITKGLEWLVRHQYPDGHWIGSGALNSHTNANAFYGDHPVVMTSIAGMALLMEGSTIREGKYHDNIRRAVNWLMARTQPNGLIGDANSPADMVRYIYGHGYAMMFLSCVVGEEENPEQRRKLVDILDRAAKFSYFAQSSRGGWGYLSSHDSPEDDEGSTTITQLQGLRAARNAGIVVPNAAIKNALKYLHDVTGIDGGVRYTLARAGGNILGQPGSKALTAAAIACGFSTGEYDSPLVKKWLRYCRDQLPPDFVERHLGHDVYTFYYFAQAVYMLGEDGWTKLFPDDKGIPLKWSTYRKVSFDSLLKYQSEDGCWGKAQGEGWDGAVGPVFATSTILSIMQLDRAALPLYQR